MAELQDATEVTQPRSSWYDGFVGMSALLDKDSKDTTPKNWRVHCTLSGPDESSLSLVFTKKRVELWFHFVDSKGEFLVGVCLQVAL